MTYANTRIVITGGAGAIGSRLCGALAEAGAGTLIVVDDLSSGYVDNIPRDAVFIRGSVDDDITLAKAFEEPVDFVFHLAAHFANQNSVDHPMRDLAVNGLGTLSLLEMSRTHGVKKFVYASSSCVYGNAGGALKEDNAPGRLDTPYAITKMLGEQYTQFFHEYYGLDTVTLRYFNSYGPGERPGQYRNVIPNFIAAAIKGESLVVTGTGDETRDFTYIDDTVRGTLLAAASSKTNGRVYNIGSGTELTVREVAEMINRLTDNAAPIIYRERRSWDHVVRRLADIAKAKKDFDFMPSHDIEGNLQKTIDWFRKENIHATV